MHRSLSNKNKASLDQLLTQRLQKADRSHRKLPSLSDPRPSHRAPDESPIINHQDQSNNTTTKSLLTIAIGKFKYALSKSQGISEETGCTALKVLDAFAKVNNNFQQLFSQLSVVLTRYSRFDSAEDYDLKTQLKAYLPQDIRELSFRELLGKIRSSFDQQLQNTKKTISARNRLIRQMEKASQEKDELVQKWKERMDNLQNDNAKLQAIKQQKQQFRKEAQELRDLYQDSVNKRSYLQQQVQELRAQKEAFKKKAQQLSVEETLMKMKMQELENQHERERHQQHIQSIKNRVDQVFVKLLQFNENLKELKRQNEELVSERMQLVARASVQFEDLTPRPNYGEGYSKLSRTKQASTKHIFSRIMEKLSIPDDWYEKPYVKNTKVNRLERKSIEIAQQLSNVKMEAKDQEWS